MLETETIEELPSFDRRPFMLGYGGKNSKHIERSQVEYHICSTKMLESGTLEYLETDDKNTLIVKNQNWESIGESTEREIRSSKVDVKMIHEIICTFDNGYNEEYAYGEDNENMYSSDYAEEDIFRIFSNNASIMTSILMEGNG